jgi:hypothetical protein
MLFNATVSELLRGLGCTSKAFMYMDTITVVCEDAETAMKELKVIEDNAAKVGLKLNLSVGKTAILCVGVDVPDNELVVKEYPCLG